jgi:YHS domain-containing protein
MSVSQSPIATGKGIPMQFTDVVCGTNVKGAILNRTSYPRPVTLAFHGAYYFFCSDLCRREFELNPNRYIKTY